MFAPYRQEIIAALEAGMTVKKIYREIIYPAMNGGCQYGALVYYVNANGLRSVTNNDGYEIVPRCSDCEHRGKMKRFQERYKEDHAALEIETADVCYIMELLPDGSRRCVHEEDITLSPETPHGSEREAAEDILKRYCMEHEGKFIALHEVVSRVKHC